MINWGNVAFLVANGFVGYFIGYRFGRLSMIEDHPSAVVPGHPSDCHECHLALAREHEGKK